MSRVSPVLVRVQFYICVVHILTKTINMVQSFFFSFFLISSFVLGTQTQTLKERRRKNRINVCTNACICTHTGHTGAHTHTHSQWTSQSQHLCVKSRFLTSRASRNNNHSRTFWAWTMSNEFDISLFFIILVGTRWCEQTQTTGSV